MFQRQFLAVDAIVSMGRATGTCWVDIRRDVTAYAHTEAAHHGFKFISPLFWHGGGCGCEFRTHECGDLSYCETCSLGSWRFAIADILTRAIYITGSEVVENRRESLSIATGERPSEWFQGRYWYAVDEAEVRAKIPPEATEFSVTDAEVAAMVAQYERAARV
jgi:hypothetical protein